VQVAVGRADQLTEQEPVQAVQVVAVQAGPHQRREHLDQLIWVVAAVGRAVQTRQVALAAPA